ncbi:hypothetical protein BDW02DRAFT_566442, partial [Decorospora gaudefroyi]
MLPAIKILPLPNDEHVTRDRQDFDPLLLHVRLHKVQPELHPLDQMVLGLLAPKFAI